MRHSRVEPRRKDVPTGSLHLYEEPAMVKHERTNIAGRLVRPIAVMLVIGTAIAGGVFAYSRSHGQRRQRQGPPLDYRARKPFDTGGFLALLPMLDAWPPSATLEQVRDAFKQGGSKSIKKLDQAMARPDLPPNQKMVLTFMKSALFNYEGDPQQAYRVTAELRDSLDNNDALAREWLYSVIYFQGVTALRIGENDNCIMCRGESSCILPIAPAAIHTRPDGSRLAIKHFTEYLQQFPDDLGVRWLLNVAQMTLGDYPDKVDRRYRLDLDRFFHSEFDIGKFRDIGHLVGVNRFNQAGGAIMDDFDGDGLLDIAVSSMDTAMPMAFYHNQGNGTFEDRSKAAGVTEQLGGLVCYQTDYNNDGRLDIFIPRGAWLPYPIRPTLLKNDGDGHFNDVTVQAGLAEPLNSNSASWADYDNDGWLDLFVACEGQPDHLYHNRGNGTFEEVAAKVGLDSSAQPGNKGSTWIDFDNDRYPDLFVNCLKGYSVLYHNNRDGTFADVTSSWGIDGPRTGFACWAWDYDNDGWLDLLATSYDRSLGDVVLGLLGQPHAKSSPRLFRNVNGTGFENKTREAGLDMVFATMGSNFADFDNDGWLDFYLGTGDPDLSTLVPNRMFKNVGGKRFSEITGSSGTGHLQKGHAVACGDWDHDGDVDLFIEMGGATYGDQYHNILFQNPGQGNNSLTVKLVGVKTNRPAIGARIKAVVAGEPALTVYRHVSSGGSFGANSLRQTIGVGKAAKIDTLQIDWPTSGTTQVFRNVAANQLIEITEFAQEYRTIPTRPIPLPE
jgi:ASPIC and UnbV/FG-GAP-like repeat